jgi:hypothetical protein
MVLGEETGIISNNQMDHFSIPNEKKYYGLSASPNNYIGPGKRPVSSQSPLIVIDNKKNIVQVLGGSGGTKILTSVAQVALINLLFKKNIKESIDYPRIHHHLSPNQILFEEKFDRVTFTFYYFNISESIFRKFLMNFDVVDMKCHVYPMEVLLYKEFNGIINRNNIGQILIFEKVEILRDINI